MSYNGHPSYEHWNVSLWINNDEGLYKLARSKRRRHFTLRAAANALKIEFEERNITQTGDGVAYTIELLEYVLEDLDA